jgi:hypothetical protein
MAVCKGTDLTLRNEDGQISTYETRAASIRLALERLGEKFAVIKTERILPLTGQVVGGFYLE